MKTIVAALSLAVAVAAVPTFPLNWMSLISDAVVLNQGGTVNPDGSICCDPTSPGCKIQTEFQAGMQYFAFTKNLTAFKAADNSGIVTDFNAGKEYEVDSNGNCQAYCPIPADDNVLYPFGIDPNATNLGSAPCGKYTCVKWETVDSIPILNITMEVTDDYVTTIGGAPAPVWEIDHIEPLGEQIGDENTTWYSWSDMDGKQFPANAFLVNGAASCPMDNNCGGNDDGAPPSNDGAVHPSSSSFFGRFGVRLVGTPYRSRLFMQANAKYLARVNKAAVLPAELEARLAEVPLNMRARARALLLGRLA